MHGKLWTAEEDDVLRAFYPTGASLVVAEKTGRDRAAVRLRARRLGVKVRPRWSAAEDGLLRDMWGHFPIGAIAAATAHSVLATYKRAAAMSLGRGCPVGFEYLQAAADRAGYSASQLRRILRWAGVPLHRAMVRRPEVPGAKHFVDPALVDNAVADWHKTETPAVAAKRYGVAGNGLRRRLREAHASGLAMPRDPAKPGGRRHWRVPSETIDAIAAQHGWRPVSKVRAEKMRRVA
jgi:hypothetical protein